METIKFSTKSFWFKYWKLIMFSPDPWKYPEDTCTFRRDLIVFTILFLVTLPFSLIFLIFRHCKRLGISDTMEEAVYIVSTALTALSTLLGAAIMDKMKCSFFEGYIYGILGVISFIVTLTITGIAIVYVTSLINTNSEKRTARKKELGSPDPIITTLWRNLKDKVCSKIEYVD